MTNIFDYLTWRGDLSMTVCPFNEIDGVILARFSYMPFECIEGYGRGMVMHIAEISNLLLAIPDIEQRVRMADDKKLLAALAESNRFRSIEISDYVNKLSCETQLQFSAITAKLSNENSYVIFRGTDNTLIGWKEDFNMSFVCPVPAQKHAVEYLNRAFSKDTQNLIIGGHSKGGNLAVYAAAFCEPEMQKKISKVYNFDGPGFDDSVLKTLEYKSICGRIKTYVPQSSVVGMLLGHEEEYIIVHSAQRNVLWQHDIYSWEVERDHFIYLETVNTSSKFIDYTLKAWIADMDYARREELIDTLYVILTKTQANTIKELNASKFSNAMIVLKSIKNLDERTKHLVTESLRLLVRAAKQEAITAFASK